MIRWERKAITGRVDNPYPIIAYVIYHSSSNGTVKRLFIPGPVTVKLNSKGILMLSCSDIGWTVGVKGVSTIGISPTKEFIILDLDTVFFFVVFFF